MNTARGIFGAVLAVGALAAIATFLAQFWPSAQSPPQPIEATRNSHSLVRPEPLAQEFADLPKTVRTVPVTRQAAPSPSPPAEQAPAARVAADPVVPATLPAHAEPVDVCARYGGHRVNFMRGHHAMWRCDYPRHR